MAEADNNTNTSAPDTERSPAPKPEDDRTLTLRVPVKFGTEEVKVLEYRTPTAADIVQYGVPCKLNVSSYEITFDEAKMNAMMAALYRQPPSMLAKLDPRDWMTAAWKIAPFFIPDLEKI